MKKFNLTLFGVEAREIQRVLSLKDREPKSVDAKLLVEYKSVEGRSKVELEFTFEEGN